MRKITTLAVTAFVNNTPFKRDNTEVIVTKNGTHLNLHGHTIATHAKASDKVLINNQGYATNTTKERLNGILDAYRADSYIFQKNFQWYISLAGQEPFKEFPSNEWVTI